MTSGVALGICQPGAAPGRPWLWRRQKSFVKFGRASATIPPRPRTRVTLRAEKRRYEGRHNREAMRLLTFTTLYPNAVAPQHGIFVETRLRKLVAAGDIAATVVAPVPWFPFRAPCFGRYADFARVPRHEDRFGIPVEHPRYPSLPKIGMNVAPALLYRWTLPAVARHLASGHDFDVIDAHYLYPDGVAAVSLGQALARPVVLTARGSDVYTLARFPIPRRLMLRAARQAAGLIAVSEALRARLVELGVDESRIVVLRNGVDLELFHPTPRDAAPSGSRLAGPVLASVGQLIPRKGHDIAIAALARTPGATLLIVGSGPERARLEKLSRTLAVGARVRFLGAMPQDDLPRVYGAADALILASSHEGWPNVLLEAMACGTPVVVSNFEGACEIVRAPAAGRIMTARSPEAAAAALAALLADPPSREATRRYAEDFGWGDTVRAQKAVYAAALARSRAGGGAAAGASEGVDG